MSLQADPFADRLEAMFADADPAPDAEAFALKVEHRIAVEARVRRTVYTACFAGAVGIAVLILTLTRGRMPSLAGLEANTINWAYQLGPAAGAMLLIWLIAELSPTPYRL